MSHFLEMVDLRGDRERIDHYLYQEGGSSSSTSETNYFVDVLALSNVTAEVELRPSLCTATAACVPLQRQVPASTLASTRRRWNSGVLRSASPPNICSTN